MASEARGYSGSAEPSDCDFAQHAGAACTRRAAGLFDLLARTRRESGCGGEVGRDRCRNDAEASRARSGGWFLRRRVAHVDSVILRMVESFVRGETFAGSGPPGIASHPAGFVHYSGNT